MFAQVALNTQLAAAAGALAAMGTIYAKTKSLDVGMAGNGAIAGLVAITAPSGYVEFQSAPIIGAIAGVLVVLGILAIDKNLDDPVGALSAHGLAGIWGTLSVGIFGSERLILDGASPGIWYGITGDASFGATLGQLGVQAVGVAATFVLVFVLSLRDVRGDQGDDRPPGVARKRRRPDWTSPHTACTDTRSSSSRLRSSASRARRPRSPMPPIAARQRQQRRLRPPSNA